MLLDSLEPFLEVLLCHRSGVDLALALLERRVFFVENLKLALDVPCVDLWAFKHLEVVNWNVRLSLSVEMGPTVLLDDAGHYVLAKVGLEYALPCKASRSVPHLQRVDGLLRRETWLARAEGTLLHVEVIIFHRRVQRLIVARAGRHLVRLELSLRFQEFLDRQSDWILNVVPQLIEPKPRWLIVFLCGLLQNHSQ